MDHYEVLGVSRSDGDDVIRRAYLALARRHHPDFHASASAREQAEHARLMTEVNDAWAVLGDPSARAAYDRELARAADPGVARRMAREQGMPEGKGWTPRRGDDWWMDDFEGWANDRDELPDDGPRSPGSRFVTMLPVGLFAASVGTFLLAVVLRGRALFAVAAIFLACSVALFVFLPMLEMTRGRNRP